MPRYLFHVRDGFSTPDETGTELSDIDEARIEAIRFTGQIFRDEARRIARGEDWYLEVTDETQLVLLRFDFISQEAPAALRPRRPTRQDEESRRGTAGPPALARRGNRGRPS